MSERPGDSPRPDAPPVEIAVDPFPLTASPDEDPAAKAPWSRTRTIMLSSLLAASLAGASVLGYVGWRIASQKDATLTVPAKIGGLSVDSSDDGRSTADYLQTALSADVDLDRAVGAVYTDGSGQNVLFFGGTTLFWTPERDLETAFGLVSDEQGAVTGVHDVPAGPLGGTMKCGSTKADGVDLPVCGWADHGSLALAMFPGRTVDESARLLGDIRSAAQTRN